MVIAVVIIAGMVYYFWATRPEEKKQTEATAENIVLSGILYAEDNPSAVIGGKMVREEDTIDGVKVIKIHEDRVEFEKDGRGWSQKVEEQQEPAPDKSGD